MYNRLLDMRFWLVTIVSGILFLSLAFSTALAETNRAQLADKIVFLHLQIDNSGVSLIDSRVVDGKLKVEKIASRRDGLSLKVEATDDLNYYSKVVENPLIKRYEYEDPDNAGQLITKLVMLEEAEFWIRVPYKADLQTISFSLTDNQPESFSKDRMPIESVIDLSFLADEVK